MRNNGLGGTPKAASVPGCPASVTEFRVGLRHAPCATTGGCVCAPNAARCPETRPALHDLRTGQARPDRGGGNCRHGGAVAGAAIGRAVLGVRRGRFGGRVTTEVGVAASRCLTPVGDVLDGLVAIVEQETAKLGNRDAWRGSSPERRLMAFPAEEFSFAASSC